MPRPPNVKPLPERERRESLHVYLDLLDRDPELAHFRAQVPGGPERKLALFAALERAALRGGAAACPPAVDDVADQLLCDVLEAIDRAPRTRNFGSAYGADRHQANLRALGAWSGEPQALELFATAFSHLNADPARSSAGSARSCSPVPHGSAQNGELIAVQTAENAGDFAMQGGIIRHAGQTSGEECGSQATLPAPAGESQTATTGRGFEGAANGRGFEGAATGRGFEMPLRPVRRGRPPALDDQAKGRLLGLMSYGLSFRQAAAQLGVHHQTLLNVLKRDEEFAQQVAEARLDAISQPLVVIVQAARKNWRAAAWLAKFLEGRRTSVYEVTPEERELARKRA